MGSKIITNNKDSWKLFSTNTDKIISEFKTEKDLRKSIAIEIAYDGKLEAIKEFMTYPNGWTVNEVAMPLNSNEDGMNEYYSWVKKISTNCKTKEDYYKKIDIKLQELLS